MRNARAIAFAKTKVAIARNNGVASSRFLHFKRYRPYFCCPNLSIVPKFLVLRSATIQVHPRFQLHKCNASALMLHSIPYADISNGPGSRPVLS